MNSEENIARMRRTHPLRRVFIQPFAIVIVSTVFIVLMMTMGLIDLRRSEKMLAGFIDDQGKRVIGVVEKLTEENMRNMIAASQKTPGATVYSFKDAVFSPDNLLTGKIVALGKEIDNHWKKEHISASYIGTFARKNNLWLVAALNAQGQLIFQSRHVSSTLTAGDADNRRTLQSAAELIKNINLLNSRNKIGFIAMSRMDNSGTIIIALDRTSMRYWAMRVSVERAMEKLGRGQGLLYLSIRNGGGYLLGSIGYAPPAGDSGVSVRPVAPRFSSRRIKFAESSVQEIVAPFSLGGEVIGDVILGLDRGNTDTILDENRRNVFLFLFVVVVITLISFILLYNNHNRHLARVVEMTRQLEKAERLSSLGMLAAGVAHEIRNPLNAISMASQRLKRYFVPADDEKRKEFEAITTVIRDEIRRLNGIIEEFLTFSRSRRLELRENAVQDVLQKIVNLVSAEASERGIGIVTDWQEEPLLIPMDTDKIQQALLNFVKNALESINGKGEVTLKARKEKNDIVKIMITDTGCGMTLDEIERIFNPEYTTKEKGLGLGLSLAHEIIRGHGGEIRVKSTKGEGSVFEIFLPMKRNGDMVMV